MPTLRYKGLSRMRTTTTPAQTPAPASDPPAPPTNVEETTTKSATTVHKEVNGKKLKFIHFTI